jgi:ADP-ribose pyrophosphatase YjhB (NUDIX family)
MKADDYVLGFMFNDELSKVALIRETEPDWQRGRLNGVVGSIEDFDGEMHIAMVREFKEETGFETKTSDWKCFLSMSDQDYNWSVYCFATKGDLSQLVSMEEEKIEIVNISDLTLVRKDLVENLTWIVGAAIDHLFDGRPAFIEVTYD